MSSAANIARREIGRMAPGRVKAILHRAWQGAPPAAIAAELQCPVQTVEHTLRTMRGRLAPPKPLPHVLSRPAPALSPPGLTAGATRPPRAQDMTGHRVGRLAVLGRAGAVSNGEASWRCRCDCGEETTVRGGSLRAGTTKSCGCLRSAPRSSRGVTRGPTTPRPPSPSPRSPPPPPRPQRSGFDAAERAAVDAAIAAGKVTRVENGAWPDAGRLDIITDQRRRQQMKRKGRHERDRKSSCADL